MRLFPAGCFVLAMMLLGCRDPKATGPEPLFPEASTRLFFADCEPTYREPGLRESVTLVDDSRDACNETIFLYGSSAVWQSNAFLVAPGTYAEGFHLVFERTEAGTNDTVSVHVAFQGIAVVIDSTFLIPLSESRLVLEMAATATLTDTSGIPRFIRLQLDGTSNSVSLATSPTTGSWVSSDAERTRLCQLEFVLQPSDGIGRPNIGIPYHFAYANGSVRDSLFLDFTGGARLNDNHAALMIGPHYGVAYVAAESGGCRDTAAFWALPAIAAFNVDTLGTFDNPPGHPLSDGVHVWFYDFEDLPEDSAAPYAVRVTDVTDVPIIWRPTSAPYGQTSVHWDQQRQLIWIVARSWSEADTAWGYTRHGVLDSTIVTPSIPDAALYRGQWVYPTASDYLRREVAICALDGTDEHVLGAYPAELSESFAGGAGFGYPGAGRYPFYSLNTFDSQGFWSSQQMIAVNDGEDFWSVQLLSADSVIVYALYGYFRGGTLQLRVLH